MKTFVFYYTHREDLGHLTRLRSILSALHRRGRGHVRLVIFQGGTKQASLPFPSFVEVFYLPHSLPGRPGTGNNDGEAVDHALNRIDFMQRHLSSIKPDAFITLFFPMGRLEARFELLPIIRWLKQAGTKIYTLVPLAYFVHGFQKVPQLLSDLRLFDRVLIHTPEEFGIDFCAKHLGPDPRIAREDFLATLRLVEHKISFTGFVLPLRKAGVSWAGLSSAQKKQKKICQVLVSRGAGTTSPGILSCAIEASRIVGRSFRFIVVAGPATPAQEMKRLFLLKENLGAKTLVLKRFLPDFIAHLRACDVSVSTAGHTAFECLFLRKKAVLIPFRDIPGRERSDQLIRAKMLQETLGASVLDYETLTPEILAQEIMKQNSNRVPDRARVNPRWFRGADISASLLLREDRRR